MSSYIKIMASTVRLLAYATVLLTLFAAFHLLLSPFLSGKALIVTRRHVPCLRSPSPQWPSPENTSPLFRHEEPRRPKLDEEPVPSRSKAGIESFRRSPCALAVAVSRRPQPVPGVGVIRWEAGSVRGVRPVQELHPAVLLLRVGYRLCQSARQAPDPGGRRCR